MVKHVTKTGDAPQADTTDVTGEGVESLADIAALGQALETVPQDAQQAAQALETEVAEIACALELLRAAVVPFAPDHTQPALLAVWTDKQLHAVAAAVVELCKFHGWTVGEFFSQYGPYIQLLAALGMPALATLKILKTPAPKPVQETHDGQQQQAKS